MAMPLLYTNAAIACSAQMGSQEEELWQGGFCKKKLS